MNKIPSGPHGSALYQGVIFDVDGVLVDSKESNMRFYNTIRAAVGLPALTKDEEGYCHMASSQEALRHIIPAEFFPQAVNAAKKIDYEASIMPMIIPRPGLIEALSLLQMLNIQLGVFTNRSRNVTNLLRYFGLDAFFTSVKTVQDVRPKPDPEGLFQIMQEWKLMPHQVLFVGDSEVDLTAASAASVPFWAFGNTSLDATTHVNNFQQFIKKIVPAT